MEAQVHSLVEMIETLPPELQKEVQDFIRFLIETRAWPGRKHLRLTWACGLREFREQFTSLELQKQAMEWWGD